MADESTTTPEQEYEALGTFAEMAESDPVELLESFAPDEELEDLASVEPFPGSGDDEEIDLSTEAEESLVAELCERLDLYDQAMTRRRRREEEIDEAYNLRGSQEQRGIDPDSAALVSEMVMSLTDQAAARIEAGIMELDPLVRVGPVEGDQEDFEAQEVYDQATSSQRFLGNYLRKGPPQFERKFPVANLRMVKLGTAVFRIDWQSSKETIRYYDKDGRIQKREKEVGGLQWELIPNDRVICWPTDLVDWQDGYEMVGHRAFYSPSEWRIKAEELDLDEEAADAVLADNPPDEAAEKRATFADMDIQATRDRDEPVMVTELWCHGHLEGYGRVKYQILLHEPTRTLLHIGWNTLHSQKHPYFPMRYKLIDGSAWGNGIGHEVIEGHKTDTALRNLELDNAMAGGYHAVKVRAGSLAETLFDRLRPGVQIPVDQMDDIEPFKLGGEAPEVGKIRHENYSWARQASGLAPVLAGMGDPTMKSGAGTGSTLALIEQASGKFEKVGRGQKLDLGAMFQHSLELCAQYAPNGVLFRYATEEDAVTFRATTYTPPRVPVSEIFHIWVEAPSIAASSEARKMSYMMAWKFAMEHLQVLEQRATELLMTENPAALQRWKHQVVRFANELARRILENHDLPGIKELLPDLPKEQPQDQIINQLHQVIQEQEQQLVQMSQQMEQMGQMLGLGQPQQGQGPPS